MSVSTQLEAHTVIFQLVHNVHAHTVIFQSTHVFLFSIGTHFSKILKRTYIGDSGSFCPVSTGEF